MRLAEIAKPGFEAQAKQDEWAVDCPRLAAETRRGAKACFANRGSQPSRYACESAAPRVGSLSRGPSGLPF